MRKVTGNNRSAPRPESSFQQVLPKRLLPSAVATRGQQGVMQLEPGEAVSGTITIMMSGFYHSHFISVLWTFRGSCGGKKGGLRKGERPSRTETRSRPDLACCRWAGHQHTAELGKAHGGCGQVPRHKLFPTEPRLPECGAAVTACRCVSSSALPSRTRLSSPRDLCPRQLQ